MLNHRAASPPRAARSAEPAYDNSWLAPTIVGAMRCAVAAFDADDGSMLFSNAAFDAAFLCGAENALTQPEFERQFQSDTALAAAGPREAHTVDDADRLHRPTGRWFNIRRSDVQRGSRQCALLELTDISQRLADEQRRRGEHQQLLFTSKVMSVGEMAATLAHELNQPIGSLLNFLNGCVLRLDRGPMQRDELRGALIESRQQCERAAAIITRIREFVRTREPKMAVVDIGALFARVATLLESEIRLHRVAVSIDVAPSLPCVMADRVMIEQVAHNLAKNAIEAMRHQSGARRLRLSAAVDASGMVEAAVCDSGPGVDAVARSQLFSPFFTTKADGLGIGLNICRSMMEFHGGSLYYSQPAEGGSRFCFSLPRHALADNANEGANP
jgi:C4-dicarboxylate-specific signal transduction histidine kinase